MADSKFARDQMEKYGWVSGSGLGKEQQGMLNPIKVSVKNNKKGVGHDPSKEFTNNWWDQMFNKTAKSISVDNHEDGVSVKTVIEEKKETKKSALYGNFIKTSTLTNSMNGRSTEVRDENLVVEEEEVLKSSKYIVSDEEMFRKCGGRTAHKGARHGLKLNGKLQRIEEHEAMLMAEFLKQKNTENGNDVEDGSKPKKKKKKNKEKEDVTSGVCEDIEDDDDDNVCNNEMTGDTKSKPRKKNKRSKLEAETEDDSNESKKHKKKKKRKEKSIEMMDPCENSDIGNLGNGCESDSKINSNKNGNDINEDTDKIKKKKKKKRKKQESDD